MDEAPSDHYALSTEVVIMGKAVDRLIALSKGKLDWSPKKNWVEEEGGLPPGIESMAVHMMENSGLTREHAIPAAVVRAKVLAAKGEARWVKEVAQWEKMKDSRAAKKAARGNK